MKLDRVAGVCASGGCPTVYATEEGDLVIQGYAIVGPSIDGGLPPGEAVVRIPRELMLQAARKLASDS